MEYGANISNPWTANHMIALDQHFDPIIFLKDILFVNQNFEHSFFNCLVISVSGAAVLMVNLAILLWIKVKERVLVDKMVTIDCVGNILMIGLFILAFPIRIWNNSFVCGLFTFFRVYTVTLNR